MSPSAAEAALALARAEYGKPATDKSASGRAAWSSAQTFAARILGALGDASVERLTQDEVLYGAYTDMIIVARIEQRLGTLDHGRVVAMADNGATDRAAAAAILLHQAGIAHGSARLIELLHATGDARYLTWRQAWAAALSLPGARVDDAFAAQLQRLQAHAAAIAALPEAQRASAFNEYGSTRLPLLIHAMVDERDDQLRQLAQQPLATYEPIDLAPFVANPGALASLLMTMQRNDTDRLTAVANLCAIADLAPPSDANLILKELADTVLADGQREAARRTDLAPAQARALPHDYLDFLTTLSGPCRPAKPIAKYFVEHNDGMLPSASWIPLDWMQDTTVDYLLGAKNNYWNPKVEAMLEGIPPDRLEALLDAKGDAAKAYPLNVYRAYHQVATRAGFLFPSYEEAGYLAAMRLDTIASRPYVFGRIEPADKDYGGGVSGVASVRLEPLDRVTRAHIRLNQSPYYHSAGFSSSRAIPVVLMLPRHVRQLRDELKDSPGAANQRLKALKALFAWACEDEPELAPQNPTLGVKKIKYATNGHHSWNADEVEKFRAKHPIGSKARLALELLLYTGGRREDAVQLGPQNVRNRRVRFIQAKNEHRSPVEVDIPLHPNLGAAIAARRSEHLTFLGTEYGKPYTPAGFGNAMRDWCDQANLRHCSAHGLRKACATALAEAMSLAGSRQNLQLSTSSPADYPIFEGEERKWRGLAAMSQFPRTTCGRGGSGNQAGTLGKKLRTTPCKVGQRAMCR